MSENQRKNKPPKRKESTNHGNQSQLSSKRLKDTSKTAIQLKTTVQIIQEFENSIAPFFPSGLPFNCQPKEISLRQSHAQNLYSDRYILFDAFSKHLFPILSLSRHYFNTLERVSILDLGFHRYKKTHLEFLGQLFNRLALLPHLNHLRMHLCHHLFLEDFKGWELVGLAG